MSTATTSAVVPAPRRRGRWAQLPAVGQVPESPAGVPRIGPVVFTLRYGNRDYQVDLSDLPCPRLVRMLAAGIVVCAGEGGSITTWDSVQQILPPLRGFVVFLARAEGDDDLGPSDLEADHIDAFEQALIDAHRKDSNQPRALLSHLVRILRHAHGANPTMFAEDLVERIGYGARVPKQKHKPLNAYPPRVFEAIRDAALADVAEIARRMGEGETLAAAGVDPEPDGWNRLENVLRHVAGHGPFTEADLQRYARAYQAKEKFGIRDINRRLYFAVHDVLAFTIAVTCLTGMEPESVKRLRADCLVSPARGFVSVQYVKPRSKGHELKQMRVADGGTLKQPGGLLRMALRLTESARTLAGSDALWCTHGNTGTIALFEKDLSAVYFGVRSWMARHGLDRLTDTDGSAIKLDVRRLRKSFKSQQYLKAAGVLADFTQGHSPDVAARHYADIPAHSEIHDLAIEAGLNEALEVALPAPMVLDEDGTRLDEGGAELAPEAVTAALSGETDVFLASCPTFHDSPFGTKGKPCPVALWGCLECPNAVFTARHLPQVLTFLDFIERERDLLPAPEWTLRYQLPWQRIVHGIRNRFRPDQIATAQAVAEGGGVRLLLPPEFTGAGAVA